MTVLHCIIVSLCFCIKYRIWRWSALFKYVVQCDAVTARSFSPKRKCPSYLKRFASIHWGRDKFAAIVLATSSTVVSWMKMYEFRIKKILMDVPGVRVSNILALVQMMACHRPGHKTPSEPIKVCLLTHTRHLASASYMYFWGWNKKKGLHWFM